MDEYTICLRVYDYHQKLHLHDISHVSLPRFVSALVYMMG